MARIRTIKPEFWQNEDLAQVGEASLLLAVGLLNYADDEGYFNANHGLIKAAVFPIREPSMTIQGMITELSNVGYIQLFSSPDGKRYGLIKNFTTHQVISRPKPSRIKDITGLTEGSVNDHGSGADGSTGKGKEGKGKEAHNFTEGDLKLAEDMYSDLRAINPEYKKPNLENWANTIRLIRERDNRSLSQIRELWSWSNNDNFWSTNILSPDKLRKQWDRLSMQKNRDGPKKPQEDDPTKGAI